MSQKNKNILFLIVLILIFFGFNYQFIDSFLEDKFENITDREKFLVTRIIDGDTIVVGEDIKVRLLGINSAERGERYYLEAKEFLEDLILNKTISMESFGEDKYYRELGMIFLGNKNVNVEIVKKGFANVYLYEERKYEDDLMGAWESCSRNLCESSSDICARCVKIKSFAGQEVVFENVCEFDCDLTNWEIKDEGRKKFIFNSVILKTGEEVLITAEDFGKDYVWTATGDTLFLRDGKGKLVLWEKY